MLIKAVRWMLKKRYFIIMDQFISFGRRNFCISMILLELSIDPSDLIRKKFLSVSGE